MSRRRRASFKRFWIIVSAIIAVPLLIGLLMLILINPNDYRSNIEAAVQRATGRALKINGDMQFGFGFSPKITIHNVDFANPPGFSRNSMVSIGSVEADVGLVSLLFGKLSIGTLNLYDPDVQLEVNSLGQSNTVFGKPGGTASSSGGGGNPADKVDIREIGIYGGRFATRNDKQSVSHLLIINRTVLHTDGRDSPMNAIVDVEYDGTPVAFNANTGPVDRLLGSGGRDAWPISIRGTSTGAQFTIDGSVADPVAVKGYVIDTTLELDDLSNFGRLAGTKLPPIHNLRASYRLSDAAGFPEIANGVMRGEASDLSKYVDGLYLDRIVLTAPASDQPIHAEVFGKFSQQPLDAVVDLGAPRELVRGLVTGTAASSAATVRPMPINITSHVAGADLSIKGQIARPAEMAGVTARVDVHIPDLNALSALVGRPLPALKNLSLSTDIASLPNDIGQGVTLKHIAFASSIGDLGGDLDVITAPRLTLRGGLSGRMLDIDALQTATARATAALSVTQPVRARVITTTSRRLIPETPIDFTPLIGQDFDLSLALGEFRLGGVPYHDVKGHAVLAAGKLVIAPLSAALPGGHFDLKFSVDSQALPPEVSLQLDAPGVAIKPLMAAFDQPDDVTGTAEIGADLVATGRTPRALAGSVSGRIGMAMVDGELDNRLFGPWLSEVMRVAHLPTDALIGGSGGNRTKLRCAAIRIDSVRGLANLNALVLQTSVAQLDGNGTMNFAEEGLNLRVRPALRTVGPVVPVPVRVTGIFASPIASIDASGAVEGVANSVGGGIVGFARNPFSTVVGAANAVVSGDDFCASGLASARGAMSAH